MSLSIVIAVDGTAAVGQGHPGQEAGAAFRFRPSGFRRALSPDRAQRAGSQGRSQERGRCPARRPDHRFQPGRRSAPSAPISSARRPPMSPPSRRCAPRCSISSATSSAHPPGGSPGAVMDGRDIGTVICPDATAKLYVDARPEVRARRRWLELQGHGHPPRRGRICWRNSMPATPPTSPARFPP